MEALRVVDTELAQHRDRRIVSDVFGGRRLSEALRDLHDRLDGELIGRLVGSALMKSPSILTTSNGRCLR
jgi:hypothetical protein